MSPTQERDKSICPHLGLADNPFDYSHEANDGHRCYLWMQRDRVDVDHQTGFCLSELHVKCPWLSLSTPAPTTGEKVYGILLSVLSVLSSYGYQLLLRLRLLATEQLLPFLTEEGIPRLKSSLFASIERLSSAPRRISQFNLSEALPATASVLKSLLAALVALPRSLFSMVKQTIQTTGARMVRSRRQDGVDAATEDDVARLMEWGKNASVRGERKTAYGYFALAGEIAPDREEVLLWKAATTEDSDEAASCLRRALELNPESGRAKAGLAALEETEPATPGPQVVIGVPIGPVTSAVPVAELLGQGVAALDEGNEEKARAIFVSATEAYPRSQEAWFWRAKMADGLDELITDLQTALDVEPTNAKVKADLDWANHRRERKLKMVELAARRVAVESRSAAPVDYKEPASGFMISLAGVASLLLGFLWVAAGIVPLFDSAFNITQWQASNLLPLLAFPRYLLSSVEFYSLIDFIPDFNLFALLPLVVGIAFMLIADGLWARSKSSVFWLLPAVVVSIVSMYLYSATTESIEIVLAVVIATLLASLLGRRALEQAPVSSL